jgi:hypothetical protein
MKRSFSIFGLILPLGLSVAVASPALADQRVPGVANIMARSAIVRVAASREFVKLTLPDGSEGRLEPSQVIRIRKALPSESERGAKTRIDWIQPMLVLETPETVASLVAPLLPTLGQLLMRDKSPIWFNALMAEGPLPLTNDNLEGGVLSGMALGNKLQLLASGPQQVYDEIAAKGGRLLPVPAPFKSVPGGTRAIIPSMEVWDEDIKQ